MNHFGWTWNTALLCTHQQGEKICLLLYSYSYIHIPFYIYFPGNSYSLINVLWLAMDARLGRKKPKPHRLITSRQCWAMVNQPRLIDFSESTRVHTGTDVTFETQTILDYFPLITNLLESSRFPSESTASPRTVTAHQSAIQLPTHPLSSKRSREETPRGALCT